MAESLFCTLRVLAFAQTKLYKTLRVRTNLKLLSVIHLCAQGILKVAFDNKPPSDENLQMKIFRCSGKS